MKYLSLAQICDLTGRSDSAVRRALKTAKVKMEKAPGVRGYRIREREAMTFISRQWPDAQLTSTHVAL